MSLVKKIKDKKVNFEFNKEYIKVVTTKIANNDALFITNSFKEMHPADAADIIEHLNQSDRESLIKLNNFKIDPEVFVELNESVQTEIITYLSKYKLRSKIEIKDISTNHVIGLISLEKFTEIQNDESKNTDTIVYRDSPVFIDPRNKKLGARILSTLEKLHLTIKKLDLKIIKAENYFLDAHALGIPIKGVENLKEQLFGLEANFEELNAIDFKKGCYVGQENTARMKLKNKLRRRLLPIETQDSVKIGDELKFNNTTIGKVLIDGAAPFALVKLFDPDFTEFNNKEISINNKKA